VPFKGVYENDEGGWSVEDEPLLNISTHVVRGYCITARVAIPADEIFAVVEKKDLRQIESGGNMDVDDPVPFSDDLLCACYGKSVLVLQ
jgi:hypothetical protein